MIYTKYPKKDLLKVKWQSLEEKVIQSWDQRAVLQWEGEKTVNMIN